MAEQGNLFWYPAIRYGKFIDGKYDKGIMFDSYIRYFLARLQCMFKYENLPDTIPAKWLESYLLCNGNALIAEVDGKLYAMTGNHGSEPNAYYIPTKYIVANPYLVNREFTIDDGFTPDANAVLIYNDTYCQGVLPLLQRFCSQLVENDITIGIADILARATLNISTADDKTKASAELYLKRLRDGDLAVMSEQAFIEGLQVREFSAAANSLTNLIELHQYIKASLFNELGLNSNYNMKRESINSNESQLNDDMLHPLIDDMLKERQEGIDRVNKMFGTDIKVTFDSAWLENEKEEQAAIDMMEAEVEETISEDDPVTDEEVEEDIPEEDDDMQVVEAEADDIVDNIEPEDTEAAPAEELLSDETVTELVEAIENLTEAIEGEEDNEDIT